MTSESSDFEETLLQYPERYSLPSLFKTDAKGKEWIHTIYTEGNVVHKIYGTVDGKKQHRQREYFGKNKGKANMTTDDEQAVKVATSEWAKQLDKGYKPTCKKGLKLYTKVMKEKGKSGGHNINAGATILGEKKKKLTKSAFNYKIGDVEMQVIPMKAPSKADIFGKKGDVLPSVAKHLDFEEGVYIQWKLDGFRCVARTQTHNDETVTVLTSNSGHEFPWLSHIREEVLKFVKGKEKLILDGLDCELYAHKLYNEDEECMDDEARFSTISSICSSRRSQPHPLESQICLYIFDLVDKSGEYDQDDRFSFLKSLFRKKPKGCDHIVLVNTKVIYDPKDVITAQEEFIEQGYEGVILRDRSLKYTPAKRALAMRKYKKFDDAEFTIIDTHRDKGVDESYFVWVCEDDEGRRFKAKPTGADEVRRKMYSKRRKYMGKKITVKYQGLSEDSIPRFPIAKGLRIEGDF
jgi:hypothetical protein